MKLWQLLFAVYNSQEKRINDVLQGAKKNVANELGFMHKIKEEVKFGLSLISRAICCCFFSVHINAAYAATYILEV